MGGPFTVDNDFQRKDNSLRKDIEELTKVRV
jgi:hypothetical protein